MGMSCTAEQSKTMEMLFAKEHAQANWGQPGTYALDGYIKPLDYGYAPHVNINISILHMLEGGTAREAGKLKIAPDGTFTMPATVRRAMKLEGA
jgi:hypothetical protein